MVSANFAITEFSEVRAARGMHRVEHGAIIYRREPLGKEEKVETHLAQLDYKDNRSERRKGAKELWS